MHLFSTKNLWVFKGRGQSVVKIPSAVAAMFVVTCHPTEVHKILSQSKPDLWDQTHVDLESISASF